MFGILDKINKNSDLKELSDEDLKSLCADIREFLISNVSVTGGHLASNLGVVELTVALHKVFDPENDKIVWDVGHQAYVHKILTGRKERFSTLRKFNGLSGFPKRSESKADVFNTGHSSTSISAALGMARARDLNGDKHSVVAVFGDGSLTGGMMYEAMNDAGRTKTPLILILNDNEMSISKNIGSVSRHLRNLRIKSGYYKSKKLIGKILNKIPLLGGKMTIFAKAVKRIVRYTVIPPTMFDDFGFDYMGPVDGHDLKAMVSALIEAKKQGSPVVLHVKTKKGKGYSFAENHPELYHGVGTFDLKKGVAESSAEDYSHSFGKALMDIAAENDKVVAITGAMPESTGLADFAVSYPKRFFDVGIAEEHAISLGAGFAVSGYIPVIPIYSSFLQRAYDQILHDICLQKLHVVIIADRAGLVGADGETHQGAYDISFLSHMPGMMILSPSNFRQLREMLEYAVNIHDGPVCIRYPRGKTQHTGDFEFEPGKGYVHTDGDDALIIASGRMVKRAYEVYELIKERNINIRIIELPTVMPLDEELIIKSALNTNMVLCLEDNVFFGGMSEHIGSLLMSSNVDCIFKAFTLPKEPVPHGSISELDRYCGLDAENIAEYIISTRTER